MNSPRIAILLVLAAFGPYVASGVRTEQIAIYLIAPALLFHSVAGRRQADPGVARLGAIWAIILVVSVWAGLNPPSGFDSPVLAGIDSMLAPFLLIAIVAFWARSADAESVLDSVQRWTVWLLAANAVVAFAMTRSPELWTVLADRWWGGAPASGLEKAVGEYAASYGRFGGVFNTPVAAGTAYSVGLCALIHLALTRRLTGWRLLVATLGILLGGVLSQSKVFLIAGLPIALILALAASPRKVGAGARLLTLTGVAAVAISQTAWWAEIGAQRMGDLLSGASNPLTVYTANRYGESAAVRSIGEAVRDQAPVAGFGAGAPALGPLDTAWVEMLARAGYIGLVAFGLWIAGVALLLMNRRSRLPRIQWWTGAATMMVLIAASTGGPSLTQNRAGTLLILNLLLLAAVNVGPRAPQPVPDFRPERLAAVR